MDNPADSDVSVDAQLKLICCQCSLSWKGAFKVVSIVGPGLGTHKIEETRIVTPRDSVSHPEWPLV